MDDIGDFRPIQPSQDSLDSEQREAQRFIQNLHHCISNNAAKYPFFRAHHYFFILDNFPRVLSHEQFNKNNQAFGSISYALDAGNKFGFTYPHDNQQRKGTKIGELLNRKMFGCPINDGTKSLTRDKNDCHSFLFNNQDNKYQIDRNLYQLRIIKKKLKSLKQSGKLLQFQSIRDRVNLHQILKHNTSLQDIQQLLASQIKTLEARKQQSAPLLRRQDAFFYDGSNNQLLYNKLQKIAKRFYSTTILQQVLKHQQIRKFINNSKQNGNRAEELSKLFYYYDTKSLCVSKDAISKFCQASDQRFTQIDGNGFPLIDFPVAFFSFNNLKVLEITERLISQRLSRSGESNFYVFKSFWKKITDRKLQLCKRDFDNRYLDTVENLKEKLIIFCNNLKNKQQVQNPLLDDLLNLGQLEGKKADYIFTRKYQKQITPREFLIIVFVNYLYRGLHKIYKFIDQNPVMIDIMSHAFYAKFQHAIFNIVGSVKFALIYQIMDKITHFILAQELSQANFKFTFSFIPDRNIAYVYRIGQENQWQSDEEDQIVSDQHEDEIKDQDNKKDMNIDIDDEQIKDRVQKKQKLQ